MAGPKGFTRTPAKTNPFCSAEYVDNVTFTINPEGGGAIITNIIANDANGNQIPGTSDKTGPASFHIYLSDNADGHTLTAGSPTTTISSGNALLIPIVANKAFLAMTDTNGQLNLQIASGAHDYYIVIVHPDGHIQVSPVIHIT